jgi:hypothetical protein
VGRRSRCIDGMVYAWSLRCFYVSMVEAICH